MSEVASLVDGLITRGTVAVKIDRVTRKVVLTGLPDDSPLHGFGAEQVVRRLMTHGSTAAKLAVQRAQQMSGVTLGTIAQR